MDWTYRLRDVGAAEGSQVSTAGFQRLRGTAHSQKVYGPLWAQPKWKFEGYKKYKQVKSKCFFCVVCTQTFQLSPRKSLLKSVFLEGDFSVSGCFTVRVKRTEFGFMVGMRPVHRHVQSQVLRERTALGHGWL